MSEPSVEKEESLMSHLLELRDRLLRCVIAILVPFVILAFFWPKAGYIYDLVAKPMIDTLPAGTKMIATGVITPFMVPMKVTALAAFLLVLPYVLYQVWAFVAPGLYQHEKRLALPLIVSSTLLFFGGMAYCYFVVFRMVFTFIAGFAPASITPAPDIEAYLGFVMTMFVAFGVAFEVPVVVVLLVRFGIATLEKLREARGYVIVGAFVIAAVVTPPDVLSQLLLAIPLCLLYEVGLLIARFIKPRSSDEQVADSNAA
jgi:sec-independent protein translocase protein TatC